MNIKDWLGVIASMFALVGTAGATGTWVADQRYVTQETMLVKEIRQLDREATFLRIKKGQGESTKSEEIYLQTIEQQLRDLKTQVGK